MEASPEQVRCFHFLLGKKNRVVFVVLGWLDNCRVLLVVSGPQSPLQFPALEVISSGGSYVVSYPSLDDFSNKRRRNAYNAKLQLEANRGAREMSHLSVVIFGASGDLAKRKT